MFGDATGAFIGEPIIDGLTIGTSWLSHVGSTVGVGVSTVGVITGEIEGLFVEEFNGDSVP